MKVLIIGQGGREHAIAWKLSQSPQVSQIYCAPGNPGTSEIAKNVAVAVDDIAGLCDFALKNAIDLTVVGPELPLTLGIVDSMREAGCHVFGPTKAAAQLEASKSFSKEVMRAAKVPTADNIVVSTREEAIDFLKKHGTPIVFKADGLAAGKGVFVSMSESDAYEAMDSLFVADKPTPVLLEQFLQGREASLIVATDGERIIPLAPSNDYKRIGDGDSGLNTGGMGTVSPTVHLSDSQYTQAISSIIQPDEAHRLAVFYTQV
jgi:phosphoribosylamine---glycine ligase